MVTSDTCSITYEMFMLAAQDFVELSHSLNDDWKLIVDNKNNHKSFLKKETFMNDGSQLLKSEFIVFYNLSYGVPSFSFNIWNSSGALLTLEDIRKMSYIPIDEKSFYSVITQQEHPLLLKPYFIVHPCHTETLLAILKNKSKNIIISFLGLISPLIKLNLPIEYGLV